MHNFLPKRFASSLAILIVLGAVFYGGYEYGLQKAPDIYKVPQVINKETEKPVEVDFSPFWRAWRVIDERYIPPRTSTSTDEKITGDQERIWGAIQGLTASLGDPYTVFFPPEETKLFESEISGTFEGVGMEVGIKDNTLTVVAPLKGTPAERAGVQAGDKILKIDDVLTDGMSTDVAVRKIRGKRGTEVRLLLARQGNGAPFEIKIIRDTINVPVIATQVRLSDGSTSPDKTLGLRDDGVFVMKLYSFTAQSPGLFRDALREFVTSGSNKLLLDLRANPGGYLEAAVDMASWFLPAGKVVVKEEHADSSDVKFYRSKGYNVFNENLKMVILVDGGSASASEILTGALSEYGIAKVVGTKTFGKGSVQELVSITSETSLKITIARWLTPSGRDISKEGITPEYIVEIKPEDLEKKQDPQMDKAIELLLSK